MISNIDIKKKKKIYISAGILCTSESTQLTSLLKWNKAGHCQTSSFYDFTKLPPHLQSRQARRGRCQNSIKMKIFGFIVSPVAALLFKHSPSIRQSLIVIGTFTSPQFQSRAPGLSSDNVIFKKFQIQYLFFKLFQHLLLSDRVRQWSRHLLHLLSSRLRNPQPLLNIR